MNIDVNYKNKRRYNTAKYPIRQSLFFVGLIWLLSKIALIGKRYKVEKINMEGLKPNQTHKEKRLANGIFRGVVTPFVFIIDINIHKSHSL